MHKKVNTLIVEPNIAPALMSLSDDCKGENVLFSLPATVAQHTNSASTTDMCCMAQQIVALTNVPEVRIAYLIITIRACSN